MVCRRTNPDEVQEMREGRGEGPSRSHDRPHMEVDVPSDGIVSAGRKGEMPVEVKRSISPFSRAMAARLGPSAIVVTAIDVTAFFLSGSPLITIEALRTELMSLQLLFKGLTNAPRF